MKPPSAQHRPLARRTLVLAHANVWALRGIVLSALACLSGANAAAAQSSDAQSSSAQQASSAPSADEAAPNAPRETSGDDVDSAVVETFDEETAYGAAVEIRVEVDAAQDPLDDTTAATTLPVRAGDTLRDVVEEAPGADVAESGGQGAFSALRLRGAELDHTDVYLDTLPLRSADGGAVDLSQLPAHLFGHATVYRGGGPAWLGSGAIGGVLRLHPGMRGESHYTLRAGAGSFRTGSVAGSLLLRHRRGALRAALTTDHSRNDYPYLHDGGTAFDTSDDEERRRSNAARTRAAGLIHWTGSVGAGELTAMVLGTARQGGEPGAGTTYAQETRRQDTQLFSALSYRQSFGNRDTAGMNGEAPHNLEVAVGGSLQRRQFDDLAGEIGLGRQASDDRYDQLFLRAATRLGLHPNVQLHLITGVQANRYRPFDAIAPSRPTVTRWSGFGTLEGRLHGRRNRSRWELRPGVRLEGTRVRESDLASPARQPTQPRVHRSFQPTFRVGALYAPIPALAFTASAAHGKRLPTLLELFGDRGALVANPNLQAEQGQSYDLGAVLRTQVGPIQLQGELRGFHLRMKDLIRYIPTSQYTAAARNAEGAHLWGVETGLRLTATRHVEGTFTGTWMRTRDDRGRELNWRPSLQFRTGVTAHTGNLQTRWLTNLTFDAQVRYRSAFVHDPAGFVRVGAATWLDFGLRAHFTGGLSVSATLRDALDRRGADFVGYPLPGRQVMVALELERGL